MKRIKEWKKELWNHKRVILISLLFLLIALFLDYQAGIYVTNTQGVVVPDLILDHTPTLDLDFLYIYFNILIIFLLFIYPLFFKIHEFHKVISQVSLLVVIRAAFTCLTHLQAPLTAFKFQIPSLISFISFENDLFFSGHTAIPFLGFLIFKNKIRYFFLGASIIMGLTVLLMHVHYSIDVFSAFFITYGSFKIGNWFFNKEIKE